jgi:hypothetical protein
VHGDSKNCTEIPPSLSPVFLGSGFSGKKYFSSLLDERCTGGEINSRGFLLWFTLCLVNVNELQSHKPHPPAWCVWLDDTKHFGESQLDNDNLIAQITFPDKVLPAYICKSLAVTQ